MRAADEHRADESKAPSEAPKQSGKPRAEGSEVAPARQIMRFSCSVEDKNPTTTIPAIKQEKERMKNL